MRSGSSAPIPTVADPGTRPGRRPAKPVFVKAAAGLAIAGLLGACTPAGGGARYTDGIGNARTAVSPAWQEVAADRTVFDLRAIGPGANADEAGSQQIAPVLAQVRRYDLGQVQRVVLANATGLRGENELVARLHPRAPGLAEALRGPTIRNQLERVRLDDAWLSEQLEARFPAEVVASGVESGRNAYGPYSFVVLRDSNRYVCYFAWQRLDATRGAYGMPGRLAAIDLELRHCQPASGASSLRSRPQAFEGLALTFMPLPLGDRYATGAMPYDRPAPDAIQAFSQPYPDSVGNAW